MLFTILESFCSFLDWEGADIRPQNRPRKIPDMFTQGVKCHTNTFLEFHDVFNPFPAIHDNSPTFSSA